jgi:MoaA/NifB/PqqE/SkfB family radical SAM enzyme
MDVAYGKEPSESIGYMTLGEYAPFMTAPHRMDLMVSAMTRDGHWNCNQKCLHCYAAGQIHSETPELSTEEWKKIIDQCRRIGIPQLTFTGGEPTMRKDLPELIEYSKWFVTRLNTNGVNLTSTLCEKLYQASLDSVQITLYSANEKEHNTLVGANNFKHTVEGIKNAVAAGLNISINTPLCSGNVNYVETLKFINSLGVKYVSCSGLIVTGNACRDISQCTQLSEEELFSILDKATKYCAEHHIEISFTSPGWVSEDKLNYLGLSIPTCGACLSNMAITPSGGVVPCQSWLSDKILGNILTDPWKNIWDSDQCTHIRKYSSDMHYDCPLNRENKK